MKKSDVLAKMRGIAHGLTGWVTFQSRCKRRAVYSEYLLYLPILELAMSQGWQVETEFAIGGIDDSGRRGDKKRIDFYFTDMEMDTAVGIEVKWVKKRADVKGDIDKLLALKGQSLHQNTYIFILLVGTIPELEKATLEPKKLKQKIFSVLETGPKRYSNVWTYKTSYETDRTKYGTVVIEVTEDLLNAS